MPRPLRAKAYPPEPDQSINLHLIHFSRGGWYWLDSVSNQLLTGKFKRIASPAIQTQRLALAQRAVASPLYYVP